MRSLLLAAAVALVTLPAQAQIGFTPLVGYDIDYSSPSVGLAFNLGVTPAILPISVSVRPSAEYIFLGDDSGFGTDADAFRLNGDLIGRFSAPTLPIAPYAKAGIGAEFVSGGVNDGTNVGANLGVGAEVNRFLAEFTLGIGSISSSRIAVGYRF